MKLSIALAALVAVAIPITSAEAVPFCKKRAEMVAWLLSAHQDRQQQQAFGLSDSGSVLEFYANSEGRWTAVLSRPDGRSCVVDRGQGLTVLRPVVTGEPAGYHTPKYPPVPRPKPRDDEGRA